MFEDADTNSEYQTFGWTRSDANIFV